MQTILTVLQVFLSLGLIGLILIQHGKGADAGAAFGSGASATVFGARGSGSFLTRATAILATLFFLTSMGLAYYATQVSEPKTIMDRVEQPAPVAPAPISDIPAVPGAEEPGGASPAQSDVPVGITIDGEPATGDREASAEPGSAESQEGAAVSSGQLEPAMDETGRASEESVPATTDDAVVGPSESVSSPPDADAPATSAPESADEAQETGAPAIAEPVIEASDDAPVEPSSEPAPQSDQAR